MPYQADLAIDHAKVSYVNGKGNAECVEFVRQATLAPSTPSWQRGRQVQRSPNNAIARGTAIATFDEDGKYPTDGSGRHAAIYLYHDDNGIRVLDQWKAQGRVAERTIPWEHATSKSRSNNGSTFYVID